jgi:hypothetical protein
VKRNMLSRRVGPLVLVREGVEEPSEQEWDHFLSFLQLAPRELSRLKVLVVTDGGAPSAAQLKRLALTLGPNHVRVAVISDSSKMRFASASIALFQRYYRQFSLAEAAPAYDHLELSPLERLTAQVGLSELEFDLQQSLEEEPS